MKKINLKSIKNFTIGLLVGMTLISTGSAYASTLSLEKVQAYLNYDLMITHNGKNVLLSNAPITYNGKTYLPLTDVGALTNTSVKYNQKERSVEMTTQGYQESAKNYDPDSISSKYGFKTVYTLEGKDYIPVREIVLKKFGFDPVEGKRLALKSMDNGEEVITNVEHISIQGAWSIEYNYYLNTILPLEK